MTDILDELYEAAERWPASPDPNIYKQASDEIRQLQADVEQMGNTIAMLRGELRTSIRAYQELRPQLEAVAELHFENGFGACCTCSGEQNILLRWPCPTAKAMGVTE